MKTTRQNEIDQLLFEKVSEILQNHETKFTKEEFISTMEFFILSYDFFPLKKD